MRRVVRPVSTTTGESPPCADLPDLPVLEELERREVGVLLAEMDGPWPPAAVLEVTEAGPGLAALLSALGRCNWVGPWPTACGASRSA